MQPAEGTDTACAALYPNFLLIYNCNVFCFDLIVLSSGLLALYGSTTRFLAFQQSSIDAKHSY